jgi:hypothetical protein
MTDQKNTRRSLLTIAAAVTATSLLPPRAHATANLTKASAGYRDIPYNGKVCAQCVYFIFKPATADGPQSQCKLIAGNINPAGWCDLWAPKASSI